jgi:hypothetical protein
MAKYRGTHTEDLENELSNNNIPHVPVQNYVQEDSEEGSFKKRYGDLRRHLQSIQNQKDEEIERLKDQLDNATRGQIKFPKTDQEIADWSARYPEVAKIIDTIASKRANEALEIGEKKIRNLEKMEAQIKRERAESELRAMHPDFDTIRSSQAFHSWVQEQPQWVQDALYKNATDARAAGRAIDLYKIDKGMKKRPASSAGAAQAVTRSSSAAPAGRGTARFTESQVAKMSDREYEKNESAIMEAMRNNQFVYDLSGGAR